PAASVREEAVKALLAKDFERVDRCVEMAIAEGRSLGAADRLRALALMLRGDRSGAQEAYQRARSQSRDDPMQVARMAILETWLLLADGRSSAALRPALKALSLSRKLGDSMGEAAALRTLSRAFAALGRERDAKALVEA